MEENSHISNNNSEEDAKNMSNIVSRLHSMKKKVKEDLEKLAITCVFGALMPTPSTKHLDTTIDKVSKSTVASNALLDCYNNLKDLTSENKIFILEILVNKLLAFTEAEILISLIQLDNLYKLIELIETKPDKPSKEKFSERIKSIKKSREFINTILQLRFNEEVK